MLNFAFIFPFLSDLQFKFELFEEIQLNKLNLIRLFLLSAILNTRHRNWSGAHWSSLCRVPAGLALDKGYVPVAWRRHNDFSLLSAS
jgi:hypothetical protein